jgi:hypothetical protein
MYISIRVLKETYNNRPYQSADTESRRESGGHRKELDGHRREAATAP